MVGDAERKTVEEVLKMTTRGLPQPAQVAIPYSGMAAFKKIAKKLNLMDDEKSGVLRTGYKGIVETWLQDLKVFIVPE